MGFDPIMMAKINAMRKSGGMGYSEQTAIIDSQLTYDEGVAAVQSPMQLVVGNTYTVKLDSGSYTCVCKASTDGNYLGNGSFLGWVVEDTGETFCIGEMVHDGVIYLAVCDVNGGTHCTIYAETIHPINPKYLPKGGVGYVETAWVEVFPTTTMAPIYDGTAVWGVSFIPEVGKEYEVTIDGITSKHTAVLVESGNMSGIVLGDTTATKAEEIDGFQLTYIIPTGGMTSTGCTLLVEDKEPVEITIGIKEKTEIVHPIDPKFLEKVVLDLNTMGIDIPNSVLSVEISDDHVAMFMQGFERRSIWVKLLVDGQDMEMMSVAYMEDGSTTYTVMLAFCNVSLTGNTLTLVM